MGITTSTHQNLLEANRIPQNIMDASQHQFTAPSTIKQTESLQSRTRTSQNRNTATSLRSLCPQIRSGSLRKEESSREAASWRTHTLPYINLSCSRPTLPSFLSFFSSHAPPNPRIVILPGSDRDSRRLDQVQHRTLREASSASTQ